MTRITVLLFPVLKGLTVDINSISHDKQSEVQKFRDRFGINRPAPETEEDHSEYWEKFAKDASGKPQMFMDPDSDERVYLIKATGERISETTAKEEADDILYDYYTDSEGNIVWFTDPRTNRWVAVDMLTHLRVKPEKIKDRDTSNLPRQPWSTVQLWTNQDTGTPAFFPDRNEPGKGYNIDKCSGKVYDGTNNYQAEEYTVIQRRKILLKQAREEHLPDCFKNHFDKYQHFINPADRCTQSFYDTVNGQFIPCLVFGEYPISEPTVVEFNEFLILNENKEPRVFQDDNGYYYLDAQSGERYDYDTTIIPLPASAKPTVAPTTDPMEEQMRIMASFKEYDGKMITDTIIQSLVMENGGLKVFENVNANDPIQQYYQISTTGEFVKRQKVGRLDIERALGSVTAADDAAMSDKRFVSEKGEIVAGSAEDLLSKFPVLPPIPNEKFVFFQLRERVASTYLKSLLTMSSQMNDQAVYTFNKTMSVTANQEILKDYVKAQANDFSRKRSIIIKDHYWFNVTKFGVEAPTWVTIVRHPLDMLYSHYSICVNGTSRNQDFHGPVCNKKWRSRGEEAFAPTLTQCLQETEQQSKGSDLLFQSDCVHSKLYESIKYTCGQHPTCRARLDQDADARARMVELTKRRILFDYTAVGIMEEFELSLQLFSKLLPAYFSLSLDIVYGQRNVGIRHIELMNILHRIRNQTKTLEKPGPEEWSDEDMRIVSKYFSYELDVYSFARQIFWNKIKTLQVARYVQREDMSQYLGQDVTKEQSARELKKFEQEQKIKNMGGATEDDWANETEEEYQQRQKQKAAALAERKANADMANNQRKYEQQQKDALEAALLQQQLLLQQQQYMQMASMGLGANPAGLDPALQQMMLLAGQQGVVNNPMMMGMAPGAQMPLAPMATEKPAEEPDNDIPEGAVPKFNPALNRNYREYL